MDEPNAKQIMVDAFKRLPTKIQQAILSADLPQKLQTISRKHNLHLDQTSSLETETVLVMLGIQPSDNFIENLERELRVEREEAVLIANDINELILKDIKDSLRELYKESDIEDNEPDRLYNQSTMKNPELESSPTRKEDILKEIEQPTPSIAERISLQQINMPRTSGGGGLYNLQNKMRDRDLNVVTEAKHLEDLRRQDAEAERAQNTPPKPSSNFVEEKLTQTVKMPKKEIEVKLPTETPPKTEPPKSIDPYREAV
jgi:hypothetical protein